MSRNSEIWEYFDVSAVDVAHVNHFHVEIVGRKCHSTQVMEGASLKRRESRQHKESSPSPVTCSTIVSNHGTTTDVSGHVRQETPMGFSLLA